MPPTVYLSIVATPVGPLTVTRAAAGITGILFPGGPIPAPADAIRDDACGDDVRRQLGEYFRGERRRFDLPLVYPGTPFQKTVWRALVEIPFGETVSYGELATKIGRPSAVRAVGAANGKNPFVIVVPCHRVIGADGSLTGFGGGLPRKRHLLEHERRLAA